MKCEFLPTFLKEFKKLKNKKVQAAINELIDHAEQARSVADLKQLKRLEGFTDYYRFRVGDIRLGVRIREEVITFMRCLHRREIYRFFP
ncbi:MAG: type II toxin-antitoxin system RelE family toxin [Tepidisphaeraceae bacterium]